MKTYDLVIVGGGMAGSTLALAVSGYGLRILLIEAAEPKVDSVPNYDDRAIALAYGSVKIFESLKVWSAMRATAEPIHKIHISERGGFGFAHMDHIKQQVPALGYVISARNLGVNLLQAMSACDDVSVMAPATVADFVQHEDQVELAVEQGGKQSVVNTRLLVAADGANSFVRNKLKLPVRQWRYGQNAVIANLSLSKPHVNIAYERFTREGPMAMLPLQGDHAALVWTVEDDELASVMNYSDTAFLAQVQKRFGWRLGRFLRAGKRSTYPLSHLRALKSVATRIAVIGNAAHSLHPIAGQGFNLGIRDVAVLAELIVQAKQQQQDVGNDLLLQQYEGLRKPDQQGVGMATDTLVRVFSNPLQSVKLARNLGLLAMDAMPAVGGELAQSAMGLHGRLSKLARGVGLG